MQMQGRIISEAYSLLPGDLRDTRACQASLEAAGFDPACPTYVLAECVLVYMEPEDSASVVRWLGHWLPTAAFVVYEQVSKGSCRLAAEDQSSTPRCPEGLKGIPYGLLPVAARRIICQAYHGLPVCVRARRMLA